ncbi:MAG: DEAD/DEAH box helicase [Mycoplasmoidaceae bacterium]|nr:MAG: DEAD/DEAH box helicase [Mycoplasmoidaceae bacterium]
MYFSQLNIKYFIKKTLESLKIKELTKIQEESLPTTIKGKSVIITSQTGSGKTYCYLIPILNQIDLSQNRTQAIIILPTKELSRQVYSKILDFKKNESKIKIELLIGSNNIDEQKNKIKNNPPHIIIGTTVRIFELLQQKIINRNISVIAFDEVDMLLDQGFAKQIDDILSFTNSDSLQKIACSATTHESIANRFSNYFKNTKVISTSKSIWANQQVVHNVVYQTDNSNPINTLGMLLKNISPYFCIVFCNTRNEANDVFKYMVANGYDNSALIHKDLSTRQRKHIFNDINENKFKYVVATDLVSRGIDITGADMIISYGLPEDSLWYMHRVGRVGRYKDSGTAFTVYRNGIDSSLNRLTNKGIKFHYYLLKGTEMIEKPLKLRVQHKRMFDQQTNDKIKQILRDGSHKVSPGYKKKMKYKIDKIKQKIRHEFIEKKIKQTLLHKNIRDTKAKQRIKNGKNKY